MAKKKPNPLTDGSTTPETIEARAKMLEEVPVPKRPAKSAGLTVFTVDAEATTSGRLYFSTVDGQQNLGLNFCVKDAKGKGSTIRVNMTYEELTDFYEWLADKLDNFEADGLDPETEEDEEDDD